MKTQLQKFEAFSSDQVSAKKGSPTNLQKQVGRGTWLVSPLTACAENRNSVSECWQDAGIRVET